MKTLTMLASATLVAGCACLTNVMVAQADPLIPLTPDENKYLEHLHQILPGTGDEAAFHNDGWLLDTGRHACEWRAFGNIGYDSTYVSPILAQVAFADLCPQ